MDFCLETIGGCTDYNAFTIRAKPFLKILFCGLCLSGTRDIKFRASTLNLPVGTSAVDPSFLGVLWMITDTMAGLNLMPL